MTVDHATTSGLNRGYRVPADRRSAARRFAAIDAQMRLAAVRRKKLIVALEAEGMNQKEVAELASISQAQVSRIVSNADAISLTDTPSEVIDMRDAGEIDDREMVEALIEMEYTFDSFPDGGNVAVDAVVPGTWREVERAFHDDRLTFDQYSEIVRAHRDELKAAAQR